MRDVEKQVPQSPPEHRQPDGNFNRRDFLKGSSAAAVATALATSGTETQAAQQAKANVAPAEPQKITLNVNGKDQEVTVEPRTLLINVLRNQLNLTGCKDVDERDAAGADTVIIDDKPVLAGSRLAIECQGQKIRTVESLRNGEMIDEVIAGFVKHDALQCGMCTPGFVMATRAFLDKNPNASLEDIQSGLGGNICRCGTYDGITQCALELAKGGA